MTVAAYLKVSVSWDTTVTLKTSRPFRKPIAFIGGNLLHKSSWATLIKTRNWDTYISNKFLTPASFADADKAKKHGMDEYICADPVRFDHHTLFRVLQSQTLEYRLVDPYCSLVSCSLSYFSCLIILVGPLVGRYY